MIRIASAVVATALLFSLPTFAQSAKVLGSLSNDAVTVTDYYKQNVYDPSDNKIGEIEDVLINNQGRVEALIIAVGGFLGAGQKDVAVPFTAVKGTKKNDKWYLTMNASKDELKNAQGFTYDRTNTRWVAQK